MHGMRTVQWVLVAIAVHGACVRTGEIQLARRPAAGGAHEGYFRDLTPHGFGTRYLDDGRRIVGVWNGNDIDDGNGIILFPGNRRRFLGSVKDLQPHGQGEMHWHGKCYVSGNWSNGKLEGLGRSRIRLAGRLELLEGEYRQGTLVEGAGIQFADDDTLFAGAVANGERNGPGYEFDGECKPVRGGLWRNGKLIEPQTLEGQEATEL